MGVVFAIFEAGGMNIEKEVYKNMANKFDASRDDLRKKNRGLVLQYIASQECTSRIELSKKMGLTKTAISNIVSEMIDTKFLIQTQKQENAELGRNPVGLDISPDAPKVAGILIMRKYCEVVLCDMKLNVLKTDKIYRDCENETELLETIYGLMDEMLMEDAHIGGIGVAMIGPLDSKAGKLVNPPYFNGIHDVEVGKLLQERYGLPVFCDTDNQSAALAEKLFGNGRNYQDILLVGIASGVGCGIIVGNEKYQSGSGYTPEIGHLSIDYHGEKCICGNRGCLELYINSIHVLKRMQAATGKFYNYKTFCELSDMPEIDGILCDIVEKLTVGLVSVINILNPDLIILGHDSVWWPDKYLEMIENTINERKFSNKQVRTKVKRAYFYEQTAVMGAACNILSKYFDGELL